MSDLHIDIDNYRLTRDGESIHLTKTEWRVLRELVLHQGQILTYRTLLQRVWGAEYADETDYIHTYIRRLRKKIESDPAEPQLILTESGMGYRYEPPKEDIPQVLSETIRIINPLPQDVGARYIGREAEVESLIQLLKDDTRLIGIYGRGGVGKTALVCKVLSDIANRQTPLGYDGIVAPSAGTTGILLSRIFQDFNRLFDADIAVSDETQRDLIPKITHLIDNLRNGRYLLFLDNLEDLQHPATHELIDRDLATFFRVVLEQSPNLQLIVTSRFPLHLPHNMKVLERVIALDDGLSTEDAIALLRACDPDGLAGLRDAPDDLLQTIAQRTRGYPRALEAVAGLLLEDSILTLDDLLQDDILYTDEIEVALMENTIQRLDESSLRVLELLALLDTPTTQETLTQLLDSHLDTFQLRAILNRLIRAYFVKYQLEQRTFSLHAIDVDYFYQRLPETGEFSQQSLHEQVAEMLWEAMDEHGTHSQLATQWFRHQLRGRDVNETGQRLLQIDQAQLSPLGRYAELNGMYAELLNKVEDGYFKRTLLMRYGKSQRAIGDAQEAITTYQRALDMGDEVAPVMDKLVRESAHGQNNLGWAYYDLGQFDTARQRWQEARGIFEYLKDLQGQGITQGGMGWVAYLQGEYEEALSHFEQASMLLDQAGDARGVGINLGDWGEVQASLGHIDEALPKIIESLAIADRYNSVREKSYKGGYLAKAYLYADELDNALEAINDVVQYPVPSNQGTVLAIQGIIQRRLGHNEQAIKSFQDAILATNKLLQYTQGLYQAVYARALAKTGLALLTEQPLADAQTDYHTATTLSNAKGVIETNLRLLDAFQSERVESLRQILRQEL